MEKRNQTTPTPVANSMREPVIRELTPELLDDYLKFFDNGAFADNPAWAGCYCMYYHFSGTDEEWDVRTASENRATISNLIRNGQAHGLLAYVDGKPVGWCKAAPRLALPKLNLHKDLQVDDADRVGSIVCFVISKPYRGRGIARRLLDAACDVLARRGFAFAEAYPRKHAESEADNYPGPLKMYLAAGFTIFREVDKRFIVRKPLLKRHIL